MTTLKTDVTVLEALSVLNALPGSYLILLPDAPRFTIVAVTDNYLADTYLQRGEAVGHGVFETLTDDPGNSEATGVKNLTASLHYVLEHQREHRMADQRYDVQNPRTGAWEYRTWRPLNRPVLDGNGNLQYIIHWVEDVTEKIELERQANEARQVVADSESRFRNMVEQAPIAITLTRGQDVVIESINAPMLQLMNKTPDENVIGKKMLDVLPELEGQPAYQRVQNVQASGKPFRGDALPVDFLINGKPEQRYFNFSYTVVEEPDAPAGVLHVAIDVTEQVKSRQKLAASEVRFRTLVEEAAVATCLFVGREMRIEVANEAMIKVWGKGRGVMGMPLAEALPELKEQHFLPLLDELFTTGNTYEAKGGRADLVVDEKLQTFYFDYSFKPLRDETGKVYAILEMANDVTEQIVARQKLVESEASLKQRVAERTTELSESNEALQTSNSELKRSNANLEEFAHAASHDLKEPIRKINLFTSQLIAKVGQRLIEEEQRLLNRIETASERMGQLVDDLLIYSEVNVRPREKEEEDLNETILRVLEDLELNIEEKRAVIHVSQLPIVKGYKWQLQQLFQNLISNSLKYTKADVPPHIIISNGITEKDGRQYHIIKVKDNGIGFHQEYAEQIFRMFTRLHGKGEYSGTGIGLSIVKKVVENHDGFLRVESQPGNGSTLSVCLPAADTTAQ